VRHTPLDAVILISTGPEMDLAETALNLRDVKPDLDIIILLDQKGGTGETAQTDAAAHAIPETRIFTIPQLKEYLTSPPWRTSWCR
jgi:hypothetical protein